MCKDTNKMFVSGKRERKIVCDVGTTSWQQERERVREREREREREILQRQTVKGSLGRDLRVAQEVFSMMRARATCFHFTSTARRRAGGRQESMAQANGGDQGNTCS